MAKEVKNYLKSVKEITAPLNWKSAPDSPPTQLAYITQPEIDMLVKANIHGSMNGKPNKGPKGIISLDGGGSFAEETGGYTGSTTPPSSGGSNQQRPPVFGSGGAGGGGGGSGDYNPNLNPAVPQPDDDDDDDDNQGDSTPAPATPTEQTDAQKKAAKAKKPEDLLKILQDKALGQQALTEKQLNIIVGLLSANKKNKKVLTKEEEGAFSNLFDENKLEEFVENYRVNYPNYFEDKTPGTLGGAMGILDSVTAGPFRPDGQNPFDLPQLEDEIGSFTLQGLDQALSSAEKRYLKEFRPDLFYGTSSVPGFGAQTSGGLADIASLDASKYEESNPDFANQIFAARAELDRMGKDMFGNKNMPTQTSGGGTYVPPTTTPDDPIIPQDPTLPPGVTPPTTTPKYPGSVVTDYTQLGLPQIYGNPQMPNYATFNRQGSMPVGLQDYLDALRKRFGIG